MTKHHDIEGNRMESGGSDPVLGPVLRSLDPGTPDPTYWFRFRSRVLAAAGRELAHRRMLADLTVSDLVVSWGRTLVPTALVAAALATFLLVQDIPAPTVLPLGVEEQLAEGLEGMSIPEVLTSEDQPDPGGVTFASEAY